MTEPQPTSTRAALPVFASYIRRVLRHPTISTNHGSAVLRLAPHAVSSVIAIGIIVQVSWAAREWIASTKSQRAISVATVRPAPAVTASAKIDAQKIINAHLFGDRQSDDAENRALPQSKVPLVAVGTIAFHDPREGFAFVGQTATSAKLFRVGEAISPNISLNAVYADHIVLDRSGSLESLFLPKKLLEGAAPPTLVASAAPVPAADVPLPDEPQLLGDMLNVRSVSLDGAEFPTYKIFPASGAKNSMAVFRRSGLRVGDLVTAIDGTPLRELSASKSILANLGKATSATIDVKRGEQRIQVVVGL